MNKTLLYTLILTTLLTGTCLGIELEPYTKLGTLDADETNHSNATGHKAMMGIGLNLIFDKEKQLQKILGFEYWTMAEPTDEDIEFPHDGIVLSGKYKYNIQLNNNTTLYPLAGLRLENWRRNSSANHKQFYGDLLFIEATTGIGIKHKNTFIEAEGLLPFWSDTDSGQKPKGNIGFAIKLGIEHNKKLNFGTFYNNNSFNRDGNQTNFRLEQYGVFIGYRF